MMGVKPELAMLAAAGADEKTMSELARCLMTAKMRAKTISPENAVIMTWSGAGWGLSFPVDARLETSLGSDYDALILPDGPRSAEKLLSNAHTRRFVSTFFLANRPVVAFGAGKQVLEKLELTGDNLAVFDRADSETTAKALEHILSWQDALVEDEKVAA